MQLRLGTLLTVVLLVIPSWGDKAKPSPQKQGTCEMQCREAQAQAYLKALEVQQCQVAGRTPDCMEQALEEQGRKLREWLDHHYPSHVLPIPPEHPHKPTLKKTSG